MNLKQKGKNWELPIIDCQIRKIVFDGFITIVFNDVYQSYLEFHSSFIVKRYDQEEKFTIRSKETLILFYEHFERNSKITEAIAYKNGCLLLKFDDNTELFVDDGPYENWHFTSIKPNNDHLFVHGGVGTVY